MGLDTSHNCFHGSYSSFKEFRNKLAVAAGYKLKSNKYTICGKEFDSIGVDMNWADFDIENFEGNWKTKPKDPLIYLIAHSDCEGIIKPAQAKLLIKRLKKLIPLLNKEDFGVLDKTYMFIAGLELAVS